MKKMCVCVDNFYINEFFKKNQEKRKRKRKKKKKNQKRKRKIMMSKENIITHVLNRIKSIEVSKYPFYNLYIENIFPEDFYEKLKKIMLYHKYNSPLEKRNWDNPDFINKKISLKKCRR
jgi:hypothetical protein